MKCRLATPQDFPVLKELWYECFLEHDSKESIDFYLENIMVLENTFVLEVNDEIVTSLQLNQHQLSLSDNIENVSFVVGVATFNKDRKKGYMRILLEYAINYAKEVYNQKIMILQAYNWDVYRPFGFVEMYYKSILAFDAIDLVKYDAVELVECSNENLLNIYNNYVENLNGFKIRNLDYYKIIKKMLKIDDVKIACSSAAYLYYSVIDNNIEVSECAFVLKEDLYPLLKSVCEIENVQYIKVKVDTYNFMSENKEIFMMIKDLDNIVINDKSRLFISELV